MGSCQSTPSGSADAFHEKNVSGEVSTVQELPDSSSGILKDSKIAKSPAINKSSRVDDCHHHSPDETEQSSNEETSSGDSGYADPVSEPKAPQKKDPPKSPRVPLSRPNAGYSSGCSSEEDYKEEYEQEAQKTPTSPSSRSHDQHLAAWKNELLADGDLSKAVVRIEVCNQNSAVLNIVNTP